MAGTDHLVDARLISGKMTLRANDTRSYCILIVLAGVLYVLLRRENSRRASLQLNEEDRDRLAFMDLTDKENPYFRYVL